MSKSNNLFPGILKNNQHIHIIFQKNFHLFRRQLIQLFSSTDSPVCGVDIPTSFGVARGESSEVTCSVESNPKAIRFTWSFNNTADTVQVPDGSYTVYENNTSVITYTPVTQLDYGTLLCYAENELGRQQSPCVLHIVPAGKGSEDLDTWKLFRVLNDTL